MGGTTERLLAFAMVVVSVALVGWTLPASVRVGLLAGVDDAIWILGVVAFAATGAVIVRSHPRHAIGWTFLWIGLFSAVSNVGLAYGVLGAEDQLDNVVPTVIGALFPVILVAALVVQPTAASVMTVGADPGSRA